MPPCIFHNRQPTCLTLTHTTICHPSLHIYDLMRNTLTPGDRGRKVSSLVYSAIQQSWSETDHGCTVPFKGGREKQEKRNFSSGQNVKQYILWLSLSVDRSWPEVRICSEYMGGSWWFRQMVKDLKWMRLKTWGKEVERKSIKKNLWRWIQSVKIFMFYEIEHQKPPTIERVLNNQADKITHSGSESLSPGNSRACSIFSRTNGPKTEMKAIPELSISPKLTWLPSRQSAQFASSSSNQPQVPYAINPGGPGRDLVEGLDVPSLNIKLLPILFPMTLVCAL